MLAAWGWLFLGGAVAHLPAQEPDAAALLPLDQAIREALDHNDRTAGARDGLEQAELGRRLARNAFHPKLVPNILGSFGQTDVANQSYRLDLTQKLATGTELRAGAGATTAENQIGRFYNTDMTLQVSQPLLRGFGKAAAKRQLTAADARLADAERVQILTEQALAVDVVGAYYRVVAQQRLSEVAMASQQRARTLLEASQAKLEVGRVSQLDVYRAQQLLAQAESQVLDARAAAEDAFDLLGALMGRTARQEFQVAPEIPRAVPATPGAEDAVALALVRRLELRSAEEAITEAERNAAFAKNSLLPQLDVNLTFTRREATEHLGGGFGLDDFEFATFFAVSMPVDRTPQIVEYHQSLIERDRRRRELETLRMRIADDVRRAVRQIERLGKGLEVADASVEFARKELEVAELRYQRGLSNNLDVVNAEGAVLSAEARRLQTLAEQAVAQVSLRATLGILDPRKDFPAEQAP
jgi:outer membrane protein TolC